MRRSAGEPAGGTFVLTIVGDIDHHTAGLFEAGLVCPSVESALAATKTGDRTPAPPRPELGPRSTVRRPGVLPSFATVA